MVSTITKTVLICILLVRHENLADSNVGFGRILNKDCAEVRDLIMHYEERSENLIVMCWKERKLF